MEREAKLSADRGPVASVLYNRLRVGMPLGADSTQTYYLRLAHPDLTPTVAQLDAPSPYNTRLNKGLPPTPVANPGLASLHGCDGSADHQRPVLRADQAGRPARLRRHQRRVRAAAGGLPGRPPVLTTAERRHQSGRGHRRSRSPLAVADPAQRRLRRPRAGLGVRGLPGPRPAGAERRWRPCACSTWPDCPSPCPTRRASSAVSTASVRPRPVSGAVNTISWATGPDGPELVGDSTDGAGFLDALRGDDGFDPTGRRCLVLGAGGAARAVCLAMAEAGAARVRVVARRAEAAEACAALAGPVGLAVGPDVLADSIDDSDLIVNASPVGMSPGDGLPFALDPALFRADQFVADLIYAPATTPLDRRRPERGGPARPTGWDPSSTRRPASWPSGPGDRRPSTSWPRRRGRRWPTGTADGVSIRAPEDGRMTGW